MGNLLLSVALLLPSSLSPPKAQKDFWIEAQAAAKLEDRLVRTTHFILTKDTKVYYNGKRVPSMKDVPAGSSVENLIYDKKTKEVESIYFITPSKEEEE